MTTQLSAASSTSIRSPSECSPTAMLLAPKRWHMFRFFFSSRRRHTRSLCDWSSDVCSSDLLTLIFRAHRLHLPAIGGVVQKISVKPGGARSVREIISELGRAKSGGDNYLVGIALLHHDIGARSEERRVGKECRSGWAPCDEK